MSDVASNHLLSALSPACRELLLRNATAVALPLRTMLYEQRSTPTYAYFLTSGIASTVTQMSDGETAEVAMTGREGLVGGLQVLGPGQDLTTSCFTQLEGTALRIPIADLRESFQYTQEVRDLVLEFVQMEMMMISQIAACNRLQEAEERLSRWLLMARDRTGSDTLGFTQEFLAQMLGARRATVTLVAGSLQRSGLIEYHRGQVKILNNESLEAAACDCYNVIKRLYDGLYSGARKR